MSPGSSLSSTTPSVGGLSPQSPAIMMPEESVDMVDLSPVETTIATSPDTPQVFSPTVSVPSSLDNTATTANVYNNNNTTTSKPKPKTAHTPSANIFWQPAPHQNSSNSEHPAVTVTDTTTPAVMSPTDDNAPPGSEEFSSGPLEPGARRSSGPTSGTSLSDLKKQRAKIREQRLYRRRNEIDGGNDDNTADDLNNGLVGNGGAALDDGTPPSSRIHHQPMTRKGRYDVAGTPDKDQRVCCLVM